VLLKIKDSSFVTPVHKNTFEVEDLEEVACDLCGGVEGQVLDTEEVFCVKKCSNCGLVYVSPQPTGESLEKYYAGFYSDTTASASETWVHTQSFNQIRRIIINSGYNSGTLLDVGCGFGHFLKTFHRPGWILSGIEPNADATRSVVGSHEQIQIINGNFTEYDFNSKYDVITSLASLEHMKSPIQMFGKTYQLLNDGGIVVVRVPFIEVFLTMKKYVNTGVYMGAPRHLFDFSPRTLSAYLRKSGFEDVRIYVGSREKVLGFANWSGVLLSKTLSKMLYYCSLKKYIFPFCGSIVATGRK